MVFRIEPQLPAEAVKTYVATAPLATHFREAKCPEVDCRQYEHGWRTVVDEATELGQAQAAYIRQKSGRIFVEAREGTLTVFLFEPGQECFAVHHQPLERPALFLVRGGDWRGDPTGMGTRLHQRPEDWVEDFADHQQRLAERIEHG